MITHVAIVTQDGIVWSLPRPNRHDDVVRKIRDCVGDRPTADELIANGLMGFLDNIGRFLGRREAFDEALRCNQLLSAHNPVDPSMRAGPVDKAPGPLFSEDIW